MPRSLRGWGRLWGGESVWRGLLLSCWEVPEWFWRMCNSRTVHLPAWRTTLPAEWCLRWSQQYLVSGCAYCENKLLSYVEYRAVHCQTISFHYLFMCLCAATVRMAQCAAAPLKWVIYCLTSSMMMTWHHPEVQFIYILIGSLFSFFFKTISRNMVSFIWSICIHRETLMLKWSVYLERRAALCPPPLVRAECNAGEKGLECARTCQNVDLPCVSLACIPGCRCPPGTVGFSVSLFVFAHSLWVTKTFEMNKMIDHQIDCRYVTAGTALHRRSVPVSITTDHMHQDRPSL